MKTLFDKLLLNNVSFAAIISGMLLSIINLSLDIAVNDKEVVRQEITSVDYKIIKHDENDFVDIDKFRCALDNECRMLAEAIYYEARGEPLEGKIAVGWVILNRADSKYFSNSIENVIKSSKQFSYRHDGSMKKGFRETKSYQEAKEVAKRILLGFFPDPTNGADHYLNPDKVKRIPKWAKEYPKVASIGNHDFHIRN